MVLRAVAALCGAMGSGVLFAAACDSPVVQTPCPALSSAPYTFHLTYAGEFIFDAGCVGARTFDGQTMTVSVGQGTAEVAIGTQTLRCSATSDYPGDAIDCDLPTGDQLRITLYAACPSTDGGATAGVELLLVHEEDAAPGSVDRPLCTSIYDTT